MKNHLTSTVAALALLGLSACNPASDPVDQAGEAIESLTQTSLGRDLAKELLRDGFSVRSGTPFNPDAFNALAESFPGEVTFTYNGLSENGTGGSIVEDFAFTVMVDGIELGLKAQKAEFWNFNSDALTARLAGENLDDGLILADRITFTNLSSVGFDELGARMSQEYNDAIADTFGSTVDVLDAADMMVIREYDITADTLILDGLRLEPYALAPASSDDYDAEELSGIHLLQGFAAASSAFSLKGLAMENTAFVFDMGIGNEGLKVNMSVPLSVLSDYKRGDIGFAANYDASFLINGAFPIDPDGMVDETIELDMDGGIRTYEVSNLQLSNVYQAVRTWTMPAHTQADFMSLGAWRIKDYHFGFDGERIFNIDLLEMDLTSFHWLLPTEIRIDLDGFRYELGTLFSTIFEMMPEGEIPEEELAQITKVMAVLERNNLDCLCGDYELNLTWAETSGALKYAENGNFADLFRTVARLDMTLTTPSQTAAALAQAVDEAVFEDQLEAALEVRAAKFELQDTGGLEALLTTAHEIGEAFPDEPGMAMLAYSDAAALRGLAVNAMRGFGPELTREVPEAAPWVDAVASWLEDGGTITFKADPPRPITAALIESYEDQEPEPSEFIDIFGISVIHTPN